MGSWSSASRAKPSAASAHAGNGYFQDLLARVLVAARFDESAPLVLDLRAGGGDILFPCLSLIRGAHVVAEDLDAERLAATRTQINRVPEWKGRVTWAAPGVGDKSRRGLFDLVLGASSLNRVTDPRQTLRRAARLLRPGGAAIFFEPFDNGHAILRLAYQEILAAPNAVDLLDPVIAFLEGLVLNFGQRSGSDRPIEMLDTLEAKWLFTRRYVVESAEAAGFLSVDILPLHSIERLFARQTEALLGQALGADPTILPEWAWTIVDRYERAFSDDLKHDLLLEGAIILRT